MLVGDCTEFALEVGLFCGDLLNVFGRMAKVLVLHTGPVGSAEGIREPGAE